MPSQLRDSPTSESLSSSNEICMIKLIQKADYKETPWKNGAGKTQEIAIYPQDATLAGDNFIWRISSAQVTGKNSFSKFINCNRHLIIWKGVGLNINQTEVLANTIFSFSGEEAIEADILKNVAVIDFGIIYKREKVNAELEIIKFTPLNTELALPLKTHLFFLADGDCQINNLKIEIGDSIQIEKETTISLTVSKTAVLYKIEITSLF